MVTSLWPAADRHPLPLHQKLERQDRSPLRVLSEEDEDAGADAGLCSFFQSVYNNRCVHLALALIVASALTWLLGNDADGSVFRATTVTWFVVGIYLGAVVVRAPPSSSAKHARTERDGTSAWRRFSQPVSDSFNNAMMTDEGAIGKQKKVKRGWVRSVFKAMNRAKESSSSALSSNFASTDSWFSDRFNKMRYTTLRDTKERTKAYWERHVSDRPSDEMQERLLRNDDFRTRPSQYPLQEVATCRPATTAPPSAIDANVLLEEGSLLPTANSCQVGQNEFGTFAPGAMYASVMHKTVRQREIDPMFKLRGMDIFRTVGLPEEKVFQQPILEKGGLRDVATFVINVMLPMCNLVLYFELPPFVKRFDDIPEETEDDPPDTKALKRFLRGDENYRRPRFKILASVVDAPWMVRSLSPQKGEITFDFDDWLKLSWHTDDERIDAVTGKRRAALLSVDIDSMGDTVTRKVLSLVQGSIQKVKLDCAVIISKPSRSKADEPAACLGLWRMDKIDMSSSSILPRKDEKLLLKEASAKLLHVNASGL